MAIFSALQFRSFQSYFSKKMRILFCTNSLGAKGGIEKVTIIKANALANIPGNQVAICFTDKGTYPLTLIHPLSSKVQVLDLHIPFWSLYPINNIKIILRFFRQIYRLRQQLRELINDFNPDVAITTGSYEKYALALTKCQAKKVREYHFNSNYRRYIRDSLSTRIIEWCEKHLLSRCFDKSFLLTKEDLSTNFLGNKRFDFQYNPFRLPPDKSICKGKSNMVIAIGRLTEQKNFKDLIKIWSQVISVCSGWRLAIVGEGEQMVELQQLAHSLKVDSSIDFLGFRYDITSLLAQAKILCVTSKYEGFGVNIIEAMSMGVVPISYCTPYGPSDIITHNYDGILVEYLNIRNFCDSLIHTMQSPSHLAYMSKNATIRAKDFEADKIAIEWMAKYQQLIENT